MKIYLLKYYLYISNILINKMLFIFLFTSSIIFIYRKNIIDKYERFNSLYNVVSLHHNNRFFILYQTLNIVCKSIIIHVLNYDLFRSNNKVKKIDRNLWEITYEINRKKYKMVVKPDRGPSDIRKIYDNNNVDITEYIGGYLGPNNDFHKSEILTPEFFNLKSIVIEKNDGSVKTFINREKLKIIK